MTEQTSLCKTIKPDYIPGTGLQAQLLNIRHIQPHRHNDAVEMMYCLQGHVWGHIAHDELHLRTGDFVTFDRDDARNIMGDKDKKYSVFVMCFWLLCTLHQRDKKTRQISVKRSG